jgi:translation initiation factor IF-2
MNLQSENTGPIEGIVLESRVDAGRGKLCTAMVQRGVLRKSAILVAGTAWAKVRSVGKKLTSLSKGVGCHE